jgi:hypothetical protein
MAQLAQCPQCDHELFVPGEITGDTRLRCPSCRAFFQLKEAHAREIATVDMPETTADESDQEIFTKQTVDDLSTMATWDGEGKEDFESDSTTEPFEPMSLHIAGQAEEAIDLDEHETIDFTVGDKDADEIVAEFESSETGEDYVPVADDAPPQQVELHVAEIDDNLNEADGPGEEESPEAAAQRIDAWFRSAKTLEDLPPVASGTAETPSPAAGDGFTPAQLAQSDDDVDFHKSDEPEVNDDFDLDLPPQPEPDAPAWDDSQHIDRLLAEIHDQPPSEYIPISAETDDEAQAEPAIVHEHAAAGDAYWTPDDS